MEELKILYRELQERSVILEAKAKEYANEANFSQAIATQASILEVLQITVRVQQLLLGNVKSLKNGN